MLTVTPLKSKIQLIDTGKKLISNETRSKIDAEWKRLTALYPRMFNGPVYSCDDIAIALDKITMTCSLTDYAHYKYSEKNDLKDEACRNI